MKVAALYSGLYRKFDGWQDNHQKILNYADTVLYTTWKGMPEPNSDTVTFEEPVIDYKPMQVAGLVERWPRMKAHVNNKGQMWLTKQILAHQYACDYIKAEKYDVVIRMRYDIWLGDHNWKEFIEKVHKENVVISFGGWSGSMDKDITICDRIVAPADMNGGSKIKDQMLDFMNMHPGYKMKNAVKLHEKKQLMPANLGWQQVLSDPYEETCINYGGGVMLSRYRQKTLKHTPGGF